jgi:hypothetical protein
MLDDQTDVGDRFRRGAQERDQTFPGVLPNQSQPRIAENGPMNGGVKIDLLVDGRQIVVQSQEMDQEPIVHALKKERVSLLPERENPVGGLNDISLFDLREPEKLPALQRVSK